MGDSFTHEFSMSGVDTGRRTPDRSMVVPNPPDPISGSNMGATTVTNPGVPIMRPSFLQAFLANLGPALAGGLAPVEGRPFGSGLGGALQGIQNQSRYNNQLALQHQEAQRQQDMAGSQMALQAEQLKQAQQINPLQVQQQQINLQRQKGILDLVNTPGGIDQIVAPMSAGLKNLTPDEQAQLDAAKSEVQGNLRQGKFDLSAYNTAVQKISQDRITTQRGAEASPFKAWKQQFIAEKGRQPNAQEIQNFQTAGQAMRIAGLENLRQDNYLDTKDGSVNTMTAGEFAAGNKSDPGRFVKYNGQVSNAIKGQSLINDIRDGITQMRGALNDKNFTLSSSGRALMSLAMKSPEGALNTVMSGMAAGGLSEAEQNYIIAHATLLERVMALRGLQGQGSGSDQQRAAIAHMLPGLVTGDKTMAERQLRTLENNVNNVASSIPKIGKRSQQSAGEATNNQSGPPAGAVGIAPGSDGQRHYHDAKGNDLGVAP